MQRNKSTLLTKIDIKIEFSNKKQISTKQTNK